MRYRGGKENDKTKNTNKNSQETMDFEAMMEQRIQSNFHRAWAKS